jgi:hypothetical protein
VNITRTINVVEVLWVAGAAFGLMYGLLVRRDAMIDVQARHDAQMNSGRETLARLLVVTSSLLSYALFIFLLVGIGAMMMPGDPRTTPMSYVLQLMLVSAEWAVTASLYYKQRVRTRVLLDDMKSEALRVAAAALVAAENLAANTQALVDNTIATEAATEAIQGQENEP